MVALTVLTPVDLSRRTSSLLNRLLGLADFVSGAGWQLVIGHANRNSLHDVKLRSQLEGKDNVRLVSESVGSGSANLARLRNIAAAQAEGEVVLLLDADIFFDIDLFRSLAEQAFAGVPLAMAPCIYLSHEGTLKLTENRDKTGIVSSALDFSPDFVMHWAMPSSVMALRREDYHALGGFCESYEGHGYEDLDFMMRLALAKSLIEEDADLLIDRPYRAPLLSEGFRNALGSLCIANLLDHKIAFHLFHGRDDADPYYQRRVDNAALFQSRFSYLKNSADEEGSARPLISTFFAECNKRGLDPARFYALFDARPRYMLKRRPLYSRLWRRFRQVA